MIHATSLSSKLFELDNYELMKQYLRKRNINGTGIDRILADIKLKNDLPGQFAAVTPPIPTIACCKQLKQFARAV